MVTTQEQYKVLRQSTRRLNIKIDLINKNDIVVDSFEGITTGGNIRIDSKSPYRRSGDFTMVLDKKYNLIPKPDSKLWFNNRIGISIGLKNYFDEIIWFEMGRFAINNLNLNFDKAEKTISAQISDYMCFLDGTLGGTLQHKITIHEDTPIQEALKTILTKLVKYSIENITIEDTELKIPYKIEKMPGSTIYELLKEIMELYMGWEYFFDAHGYLVIQKIKDKRQDPVIESFDGKDKDFTINSNVGIDFQNVKNSVQVWGSQLDNGIQISHLYRNRWARNNYSDLSHLNDKQSGDICYIEMEDNSYVYENNSWESLGFNVIKEFSIESIGEKVHVYNDDKIFNDIQSKLRCEYELINYSNFAETINFSIVPLYNLKVNNKIYINIDNLITGEYLINCINVLLDISSAMNINCHKLYY